MPTLKRISQIKYDKSRTNNDFGKSNQPCYQSGDNEKCGSDDRFSQPIDTDTSAAVPKSTFDPAPFSILSAITRHRTYTESKQINESCECSVSDIVAVVLSWTIQQDFQPKVAPHSKHRKSFHNSRIRVLLGDPSLPSGQCARVTFKISPGNISHNMIPLFGLHGMEGLSAREAIMKSSCHESTQLKLGELQPGDVVRFNRLEVRNINDELMDMLSNQNHPPSQNTELENCAADSTTVTSFHGHHSLQNVACELFPSWKESTLGSTAARLCRVNPKHRRGNIIDCMTSHELKFNLDWESVEPSMETPRESVSELISWYFSDEKANRSMTIVPANQPCIRRRLRDITIQNMVSHVVVKVLRCEKITSPRGNSSIGSSINAANNHHVTYEPIISHATLSDGQESDDLIGIVGSVHLGQISGESCFIPKSISTILLQSLMAGSYILLTHVMSRRIIGENAMVCGRESLSLVPTRDSVATIITPDHPFYIRTPRHRIENSFFSQPLTVERATQLFSLSQQNSPVDPSRVDSQLSICRGVMAVVSPLVDIIVDGIYASICEGQYWQTEQALSKFLIDTPTITTGLKAFTLDSTYRSATIILDSKIFSKEMVVNADGDALKLLCMDVPAADMVLNLDHPILQHPYLSHVGALLQALCEERTPIRWVLEQESELSWFVSSASLLEI